MSNDIVTALKGLSLHGMASAWPEVLGTARIKTLDHETVLHQLLKAEAAQRGFHAGTAENSVTPNPAGQESVHRLHISAHRGRRFRLIVDAISA